MLNLTAIGYSDEFANFMKKYSSEILRQNGISEEQLNLPRFYYSMTGKQSGFADNSVDSNANVAYARSR